MWPLGIMLITIIRDVIWRVLPPVGGGLCWCTLYPSWSGGGDGCSFIAGFPFFKDNVYEVFDGILVYIFHEVFLLLILIFLGWEGSLFMECSCRTPLTPIVMIMRALVFHPLTCHSHISLCSRRQNLACFPYDITLTNIHLPMIWAQTHVLILV